ncbi:hypothetical protein GCM10010232_15860 [Streptomyces amakusaensis]|uniref:Wadjet protein JetD C-terminal domain-containing protein n=1 Tax=Streptomyces amakusaensis TaxID=67271 RepID=A0ABW0AHB0_9ACTN
MTGGRALTFDYDPLRPDPPPGPAADLLGALRRFASDSRKWPGTTATRILLDDVRKVFHSVHRPGYKDELPDAVLLARLTELVTAEAIGWSAGTVRERYRLPRHITLTPVKSSVRLKRPAPVWYSELRGVAPYWDSGTEKIQAAYEALNAWLHAGDYGSMEIPWRERAMRIFGQHPFFQQHKHPAEKVLDKFSARPVFSDLSELYRLTRSFAVDLPLLTKTFPRVVELGKEAGFHPVEGGRGLLVVENSTTYWSIAKRLDSISHDLGYIAWGIGWNFASSIASIAPAHDVSHIRYFGDLDPAGLRIPLRANTRISGSHIPEVLPAVELYDSLLQLGVPGRVPPRERNVSRAEAERLASWLAPHQRPAAIDLMLSGQRLAQEWVGLDHLTSDHRWHRAIRFQGRAK